MPEFFTQTGGDHRAPATVHEASWTQSQGGTWGIEILFDLDEDARPAALGGMTSIVHKIWINANTANMAYKQLKSLGIDTDSVDAGQFRNAIGDLLRGAECVLVITYEEANEYHADPIWKVKFVNAPGGDELPDSFDPLAVLKSRPKSGKKKGRPAPTPIEAAAAGVVSTPSGGTAVGPEGYDDDVPF